MVDLRFWEKKGVARKWPYLGIWGISVIWGKQKPLVLRKMFGGNSFGRIFSLGQFLKVRLVAPTSGHLWAHPISREGVQKPPCQKNASRCDVFFFSCPIISRGRTPGHLRAYFPNRLFLNAQKSKGCEPWSANRELRGWRRRGLSRGVSRAAWKRRINRELEGKKAHKPWIREGLNREVQTVN